MMKIDIVLKSDVKVVAHSEAVQKTSTTFKLFILDSITSLKSKLPPTLMTKIVAPLALCYLPFTGALGGRSVDFFRNFRHTYLSGFLLYSNDQEIQNYLRDRAKLSSKLLQSFIQIKIKPPMTPHDFFSS